MEELCFPQLNTSCRRLEPPQIKPVVLYILVISSSLLTASLNLLVIISISHFRQLHSPTNLLLLSLAVSDFLVGLLVMPIEGLLHSSCWLLGDLMCLLYYIVSFTLTSGSVGSMVLISLDRYFAICDPLLYTVRITKKLVNLSVCLCWICSAFYSIFLLFDHLKEPGRYTSCHGECVISIKGYVDIVVAFIIPIIAIIVLYMRVFVVVMSQARAIRCRVAAVKSELKAAKNLGVVVVVFMICYSPGYCIYLTGKNILIDSSKIFMGYAFYLNSCLNPLIYASLYPWFRKAIRLIFSLQILKPDSREANML